MITQELLWGMRGDITGHTRNLDNGSFSPYAGNALSSQNGKFLVDAYSITVFLVVWVLTSCDDGRASSVENLVVGIECACEGLRPSNIWFWFPCLHSFPSRCMDDAGNAAPARVSEDRT